MINLRNNLNKILPKSLGQGMVEFALALPILLTLLYGVLEAGRLIFIYASTVTAARQAVRYGSTTGVNADNIPYYRDCDGIRSAAKKVGFINSFNDSDIYITYDRGLDGDGDVLPIPNIDASPNANTCTVIGDDRLRNGDRIKVQVSTQWSPIISIVPSWQGFTITSSTERTFLVSVALSVDPVAQAWIPSGSGTLQLDITGSPSTFSSAGQTITYTYVLTNAGTINLTAPFNVTDNHATANCSGAPASLSPGLSATCTGTYLTTQSDVDAGEVTNLATGSSLEAVSNQNGVTIFASQTPALTLQKSASPTIAQSEGVNIAYTYTLTNSGNVTLSSPYSVSDNKINASQINCSSAASPLAPGDSTTCSGTYNITNGDMTNGSVTNYATAGAKFGGRTISSNIADATVITSPISLTVTPSLATVDHLNQQITYTFTLQNISNDILTSPYSVSDDKVSGITCSFLSSLAPGDSTTCQGTYFVTQADLDTGGVINNRATAHAKSGSLDVSSNQVSASVSITQIPALAISISPSESIVAGLNSSISYTYVLTNTGNVTLSGPYAVTDLKLGTPSCALAAPLAPSAATPCTLGYTVTQNDLNLGSIINTAKATAQFASQPVISPEQTATVITYNNPRLSLEITSMPDSYSNVGAILNISFILRNTGNTLITSPYAISASSFLTNINCNNANGQLAIGQETKCVASYTTTSSDMTNGSVSVVATAAALSGSDPINSNPASLSISSAFQCFVYHRSTTTLTSSVTYSTRAMYINLINDSATGGIIHIEQIQVSNWNYSSYSSQYITAIKLGGVTIYEGNIQQRVDPMYYTDPFLGDVSVPPGSTKVLEFTFNKNYNPTGNEQIKVSFNEGGCPVLDTSNITQVK